MGLTSDGIRTLFMAKKSNASFATTLMLGRQNIYCSLKEIRKLATYYQVNEAEMDKLVFKDNYSEPFFKALGATTIDSMDFSAYENATVIHDLNLPVPESLKEKYSMIVESGTLEHVFNFPTAIKNCMEMVGLNGHIVMITTGNNYMGHGFYQFSPELFYRVFSPENGFEVKNMFLTTKKRNLTKASWYSVADPNDVKSRIQIINDRAVSVIVIVKKIARKEIFTTPPLQSDYQVIWQSPGSPEDGMESGGFVKIYRKYMPAGLKKIIDYFRKKTKTTRDLGEIDTDHIKKIRF